MLSCESPSAPPPVPTAAPTPEAIALSRLAILRLADESRNVSLACRQAGISRSRFYELKAAYEKDGIAGLTPQPRRKPRMPNQTSPETAEQVLEMTRRYPTYSYVRVSERLRASGLQISPSTVRSVWERGGLRSRADRLRWIERNTGALPDRYARLLPPEGSQESE